MHYLLMFLIKFILNAYAKLHLINSRLVNRCQQMFDEYSLSASVYIFYVVISLLKEANGAI